MISYTHMAVNRATRLFLYCESSSLAQASRFSFKIPALLCCQGFKQDIHMSPLPGNKAPFSQAQVFPLCYSQHKGSPRVPEVFH